MNEVDAAAVLGAMDARYRQLLTRHAAEVANYMSEIAHLEAYITQLRTELSSLREQAWDQGDSA